MKFKADIRSWISVIRLKGRAVLADQHPTDQEPWAATQTKRFTAQAKEKTLAREPASVWQMKL